MVCKNGALREHVLAVGAHLDGFGLVDADIGIEDECRRQAVEVSDVPRRRIDVDEVEQVFERCRKLVADGCAVHVEVAVTQTDGHAGRIAGRRILGIDAARRSEQSIQLHQEEGKVLWTLIQRGDLPADITKWGDSFHKVHQAADAAYPGWRDYDDDENYDDDDG